MRCSFQFLAALFLLGCLGSCPAAGIAQLDDATPGLTLTPFLSLFRDPSARQTLADVQRDWARGEVPSTSRRWPSFGFTQDAIWVRFTAQNPGRNPALWFLELQTPRMDEVDAHLIRASGQVEHFAAGHGRPAAPPPVMARNPVFPLALSPGEKVECLVRVHSETAVQLPLKLWEAKAFAPAQVRAGMFDAVFLGYLFALIMLGLVFGAFSRDRGYISYSLSLAGIFVSCGIMSGHWAWLGLPGGDFMAKRGVLLAGEFSAFMHVAFLRQLLDLGRVMPRVDRWAARVMWAWAAATPALVAGPHRITFPILLGHHVLLGAVLMIVALAAWRQGLRVARYYALAWMVFWVCFACSNSLFLARQPLPHRVWVYTLVGTAASGTLFLVAMGDRVREIRGTALAAQAQLLAVERQAAEELRRKLRQEQVLIRDLHDGIGGLTANLAILAEVGRRDAPAQPEQERFARISQLASDGAAEVRSLMSSLEAREMSWPDFLDECRRHGQRALPPHGIAFDLAESGRPDAEGPDVFAGLSLLRVIKEALTNAVKHAGCTRVSVLAEFSPGRLRLTVRDNGRGLPSAPGHGRGLRNMDSRIRELGGTMTCRSESGLELVFELPLPVVLQATPAEGSA